MHVIIIATIFILFICPELNSSEQKCFSHCGMPSTHFLDYSLRQCTSGCRGPGYLSPDEARLCGPREKVLFITAPSPIVAVCKNNTGYDGSEPETDQQPPDLIVSVDIDPDSETYCKIIGKLALPPPALAANSCGISDGRHEVHHTGWNACSSCVNRPGVARSLLVVPGLHSSNVFGVDVSDPHNLKLSKTIDGQRLATEFDVSFPHTVHCLPDGKVMISTLGDAKGNNKGDFILLDSITLEPVGKWPKNGQTTPFGYDFWYQPRQGLMLSSEWGTPNEIRKGFDPNSVTQYYGHTVHVWDWASHQLLQSIELPQPDGLVPLEVRFMHNPEKSHAFVGTAVGSSIFHFYAKNETSDPHSTQRPPQTMRKPSPTGMEWQLAFAIPPKRVQGWVLPEMPALITDILISMDDRFLYLNCWFHGEIRQYDISDPFNLKLVGQIFIGGIIHAENGTVIELDDNGNKKNQPAQAEFDDGTVVRGGPQMLQLSLDGKRLYTTTSLYSVWDRQFYPGLAEHGAMLLQIDVDTEGGGLSLNKRFKVSFDRSEELPEGPYLAHEMRYPGGDCTSDIWL